MRMCCQPGERNALVLELGVFESQLLHPCIQRLRHGRRRRCRQLRLCRALNIVLPCWVGSIAADRAFPICKSLRLGAFLIFWNSVPLRMVSSGMRILLGEIVKVSTLALKNVLFENVYLVCRLARCVLVCCARSSRPRPYQHAMPSDTSRQSTLWRRSRLARAARPQEMDRWGAPSCSRC